MSSGQYCLIRDLGLVKGGKGLRHHEVVLTLSWRGISVFLLTLLREVRWREAFGRGTRIGLADAQVRAAGERPDAAGLTFGHEGQGASRAGL